MQFIVLNPDGSPSSGAQLEVRRQGAQIRGSNANSPYTVDDVGSVADGASVKIFLRATATETSAGSATVNSATQIATTPSLGNAADNDRLTISSPLPSIYQDTQSDQLATTNPLVTDSEGYAECYAPAGFYDVKKSGSGITTVLYTDVVCSGSNALTYVFDANTAVAYVFDTKGAKSGGALAVAGAKIASFRNNGVEKVSIDKDGAIAGGAISGSTVSTTGAISSGAGITAATTIAATAGVSGTTVTATGLISGSAGLTISAGAVSLPAGAIATAALAASAVTNAVSGTAAGPTTLLAPTTLITLTPTITSTSSVCLLIGVSVLTASAGAAYYNPTLDIYDSGAATVLHTATTTVNNAGPNIMTVTAMHVVTGTSGAKTYLLRGLAGTANVNATASRFFFVELKK
jgi:hypothetical protein